MNRNIICVIGLAMLFTPSWATAQSGTRSTSRSAPSRQTVARRSIAATNSNNSTARAAVVELFTSQGCSSCPPADALLQQIVSTAEKSKVPVYALSFHVDYWNRLGWTDPYSSASYSKRQRDYAAASQSSRVYTPQMVVNGTSEFNGSNKSKAYDAISTSLKQKSQSSVVLKVRSTSSQQRLVADFSVSGKTAGHVLNIALVQNPEANLVPNGENAGRQLSHVHVVRDFKTTPLSQHSGSVTLDLPDDADISQVSVVAYVQDARSLMIGGAAAVKP